VKANALLYFSQILAGLPLRPNLVYTSQDVRFASSRNLQILLQRGMDNDRSVAFIHFRIWLCGHGSTQVDWGPREICLQRPRRSFAWDWAMLPGNWFEPLKELRGQRVGWHYDPVR